MSDNFQSIVFSLTSVLIVAIICGAFAYGCTTTNRQYYDAFNQCIATGGSAVPTSQAGSGIVCIKK